MRRSLITRVSKRLQWEQYRWIDRFGDWQLNIDTTWTRPKGALDPSAESTPYEASSYPALESISRRVVMSSTDTLVDIGCGAGRAVCFFSRLRLKRSMGVEFNPVLAARASANLAQVKGRKSETSIIVGGAEDSDYAGCTIVFMFNPFGPETLEKVLLKLEQEASSARTTIIYQHPLQARVVDAQPWLRLADEFSVPHLIGDTAVRIYERR